MIVMWQGYGEKRIDSPGMKKWQDREAKKPAPKPPEKPKAAPKKSKTK